ncbi:MAG: hypothetical protein ACHBN1_27045 [Heteroscytonema crispum UTEX LB 1556]
MIEAISKSLGCSPNRRIITRLAPPKGCGWFGLVQALWQWVFTRLEPRRSRLKNEIGLILGQQLDEEKAAGRLVKLVRMRVAFSGVNKNVLPKKRLE